MDATEKNARATSFGSVAQVYDEYRPDYPAEAIQWLIGEQPARVLELGAGTGKLTSVLCSLGHDVVATEPIAEMLGYLRKTVPQAHLVVGRAESIPLPSSSVDVVIAGQAYHWFDRERALPEIARVLRPGGVLAVVWTYGDGRVPWVKKLFSMVEIDPGRHGVDPFEDSDLFDLDESHAVKHWQKFRRDNVTGFVASTSTAARLSPADREALVAKAGDLYDGYGRGPDGLLMPWLTSCYRARVAGFEPQPIATPAEAPDLDDGLLIDFN